MICSFRTRNQQFLYLKMTAVSFGNTKTAHMFLKISTVTNDLNVILTGSVIDRIVTWPTQ